MTPSRNPDELHNLAHAPGYRDQLMRLAEHLAALADTEIGTADLPGERALQRG